MYVLHLKSWQMYNNVGIAVKVLADVHVGFTVEVLADVHVGITVKVLADVQ